MTIKKIFFAFLIIFIQIFSFSADVFAVTTAGRTVEAIEIKGNQRIDESTILYYIHTKIGNLYSAKSVREDIKRIYTIGHFSDVKVDATEKGEGLLLVYIVVEKPTIASVSIDGNDDVSEEDITEKIKLKKGEALNQTLLKESIEAIKEVYRQKGFYFAEIIEEIKATESNQATVLFRIKEGEKIKIKNIVFTGNERFSSRKLRKQMKTKEKGWFSWISSSGIYNKEFLRGDTLQLESFYQDYGYARIVISEPDILIDHENNRIDITIPVKEGKKFAIGAIKIEGDDTFTREELLKEVELKKGDLFNRSLLREDVFRINKRYSQKGYAYADISPLISINDDSLEVDITLDITRGKKFYIGKITIKGNDKTRDRVIRREFRLVEGEVFDSWKLERSRERIFNLGFFDNVKLDVSRGEEDDLVDINATVEERSTGQFSVSAGYSSVEKFVFSAQISFANLNGRGQRVSFTAERSSIRKQFVVDFFEPWVFDKEISAGFDVFNKELDNNNNKSISFGGGLRFGKALGEYTNGLMKYRFKHLDIREVSNPNIFNQEGVLKISSLIPSITRDSKDNIFNPTKGSKIILSGEYAGGLLLGGTNFYNMNFEASKYYPLKWKFVGLLHTRVGYAQAYGNDDLIPITERYFLDGLTGMRGFNSRDIGPRDVDGPLGGEKLLLFNVEIHYPFTEAFRAMIFYDRGNIYGIGPDMELTVDEYNLSRMRHSYGFGIRFFTPIGPIGLSYGIKLDRKKGESAGEMHFNIGRMF